MASTINASTSPAAIVQTADGTANLNLQSNGTTIAALTSTGMAVTGTLSSSGVSTFAAGTAALPAITTTGNTNTGLWFPAADTIAASTGGSERMRIDSSGNLFVGTTTTRAKITTDFNGSTNNGIGLNDTASATGALFVGFYNNGSVIGSVVRVGATSAVVYNTTSDERLKSNIVDSDSVLDTLMQVQVRQYDWTEGNMHQEYGFIAQELEPVLSGIVTKGKTDDDMWQLDYSRLTPHLVKAIQEQQALITSLTARITALEGELFCQA